MSGITTEELPLYCSRLEKAVLEAKRRKSTFKMDRDQEFTDWRVERPFLNLDYSTVDKTLYEGEDLQQESVVEALLNIFMGGQSDLIVPIPLESNELRKFNINIINDPFEAEFAKKCISLAQYYSSLAKFTQDNYLLSQGRVNGALAAGIDDIIDEYMKFIVNLESAHKTKKLTIHELWYHIQPLMETMRVIDSLISTIRNAEATGSQTLTLIYEYTSQMTVWNLEKQICLDLTSLAAVPYMESVEKWIFDGEIHDPYDEFMIVENVIGSEQSWKKVEVYWEKKYQVRSSQVPCFLSDVETEILNAGKYLNVVKECSTNYKLAEIETLKYDEKGTYKNIIVKAYNHSSLELLNYMLEHYKIKERIVSMKSFFLLQNGDYVVQLLDSCEEELSKETSEILPSRLTTLVESSLRTHCTAPDPYRDDICISIQKLTLSQQVFKIIGDPNNQTDDNSYREMTGFDSFAININTEWPITLVVHNKVISSYQMLFRHLFFCKYIEKILCDVWRLSLAVKNDLFEKNSVTTRTHALTRKMLIFVQNIEYYMMEEAIETNWMEFEKELVNVKTIDALINSHWNFIDISMKDCLVTDWDLFSKLKNLLVNCKEFGDLIKSIKSLTEIARYPNFEQRIQQIENDFTNSLKSLIQILDTVIINDKTSKLEKLASRLRFVFMNNEDED